MKVKRNAPCPCGSGRKYKQCCLSNERGREFEDRLQPREPDWRKVEEAEVNPSASSEWPDEPLHPESPASMSDDSGPRIDDDSPDEAEPDRDPLRQAMDARWEEFEACEDFDGRAAVFIKTLDEPELMDDEMAFYMLDAIRAGATQHDDWGRLEILIRALQERVPETFAKGAAVYISWMIDERICRGRFDEIEPLAKEIGQYAGEDIDIFDITLDSLAYHCRLPVLVEMMGIAWPGVRDSAEILPWGVDEFVNTAFRYEMLDYCERAASPRPDDPELIERLEFYVDSVNQDFVSAFIGAVTGRVQQAVNPGSSPGKWCQRLCFEFLGHLVNEEGVAAGRANLASENLSTYLLKRLDREFKRPPRLYNPGERPQRRKGKSRRKQARAVHVLCPDRTTFHPFLASQLDFLCAQRYTVAATMEMIPAWLRFLESRELINAEEHSVALDELTGIHRELVRFWQDSADDPARYEAAVRAWQEPQTAGQNTLSKS